MQHRCASNERTTVHKENFVSDISGRGRRSQFGRLLVSYEIEHRRNPGNIARATSPRIRCGQSAQTVVCRSPMQLAEHIPVNVPHLLPAFRTKC